jgi:heptosyltransferase-2
MSKHILVRAPNWLGDAVMATPFLKRLAERNPGAAIEVFAPAGVAGVFQGAPGVSAVFPIQRKDGPFALARALRARRYDAAYILPPSFSSALATALARIPIRIGYAADFRSPLLTEARPLEERYHYVRRYLGLLGDSGADVGAEDLFVPRASNDEMAGLPGAAGLRGKILALAPGSRAPARRWFPERFADVVNGLGSEWQGVALLGAPGDRPQADAVARACRRPVLNLCGATTLPQAAALLGRCAALLTNESGLMHVGWAVGTPLVVIAGPSDPRVTSPFGRRVRILQAREVPCVPCVRNDCYRIAEEHMECLQRITSARVLEALEGF